MLEYLEWFAFVGATLLFGEFYIYVLARLGFPFARAVRKYGKEE